MSLDFETSQGLVLRSVVVAAPPPISVEPFNRHGRLDAFVFKNRVGVFIKYSSMRLTPWKFTFHIDQVSELLDLETEYASSFVVFVCGEDGLVTIDMATLHDLVSFKGTEQAWVRIERKPRKLYSLSGNRAELSNKVARGVAPIIDALNS